MNVFRFALLGPLGFLLLLGVAGCSSMTAEDRERLYAAGGTVIDGVRIGLIGYSAGKSGSGDLAEKMLTGIDAATAAHAEFGVGCRALLDTNEAIAPSLLMSECGLRPI